MEKLPFIAAGYPVAVITGPRQAGKTTLARGQIISSGIEYFRGLSVY